ncbi:unnamed protein product, partial [marine sediment metagenome]
LTVESDPVWTGVSNLFATTNWVTLQAYLTAEVDPVFLAWLGTNQNLNRIYHTNADNAVLDYSFAVLTNVGPVYITKTNINGVALSVAGDIAMNGNQIPELDAGIDPSNAVNREFVESLLGTHLDLWTTADSGLTNSRTGLTPTNTVVFTAAATNNHHIFFWSTKTNYLTDIAVDQKFELDMFVEMDEDKTVGIQFEAYYSNITDGVVEFIDGNSALITKKDVKTTVRLFGYPNVSTNIGNSIIGVAVVVVDLTGKTPDTTLYME